MDHLSFKSAPEMRNGQFWDVITFLFRQIRRTQYPWSSSPLKPVGARFWSWERGSGPESEVLVLRARDQSRKFERNNADAQLPPLSKLLVDGCQREEEEVLFLILLLTASFARSISVIIGIIIRIKTGVFICLDMCFPPFSLQGGLTFFFVEHLASE